MFDCSNIPNVKNTNLKRSVLFYGISFASLVFLLKLIEYRYYIQGLRLEFYIALVAMFFVALGGWVGLQLVRKKPLEDQLINFKNVDEAIIKRTGLSKREFEVLTLISRGDSNQQIADKLFVSQNTVKTHLSNLYVKLDAKRRTQAVQRARQLHIIP